MLLRHARETSNKEPPARSASTSIPAAATCTQMEASRDELEK